MYSQPVKSYDEFTARGRAWQWSRPIYLLLAHIDLANHERDINRYLDNPDTHVVSISAPGTSHVGTVVSAVVYQERITEDAS